ARYVTILLGANDLCTSSPSTMTSPETFRAYFSQAMATLLAPGQDRYVFVSSIPNIYQLWQGRDTKALCRAGGGPTRAPTPLGGARGKGLQPDPGRGLRQLQPLPLGQQGGLQLSVQRQPGQQPGLLPPQLERPGGPGPGHLGRVLVGQQLPQQPDPAAVRSCMSTGVGVGPSGWTAAVGRAVSLVNPGAWVVTRSGRRVRPGSAADSGFTPSL